jgi:hypothetical protein
MIYLFSKILLASGQGVPRQGALALAATSESKSRFLAWRTCTQLRACYCLLISVSAGLASTPTHRFPLPRFALSTVERAIPPANRGTGQRGSSRPTYCFTGPRLPVTTRLVIETFATYTLLFCPLSFMKHEQRLLQRHENGQDSPSFVAYA